MADVQHNKLRLALIVVAAITFLIVILVNIAATVSQLGEWLVFCAISGSY